MDAATGAPEKMHARSDELTPMLSQYYELAQAYDDCLLLFQVGDFYEAFCEAAERIARLLEITLTKRQDSTGTYAMAGIPIDNAESYIETLLDAGYRVAIADQVEDPDSVHGVVERAVTRIVTPGMVTESELLAEDSSRFVAAAVETGDTYGLAALDVSTGQCIATTATTPSTVTDELARFDPAEVIAPSSARALVDEYPVADYDDQAFEPACANGRVRAYFGPPDRVTTAPAQARAVGALLAYAEYTRGGQPAADATAAEPVVDPLTDPDAEPRLPYITHLTQYDPGEYMMLDSVALQSLELFERRTVDGSSDATLFAVLDQTTTALGSRRLREWLRRPLLDPEAIRRRHTVVEALATAPATRDHLGDLLTDVYDIERLVARIARGRADARDLRSLATTLGAVPAIRDALAGMAAGPVDDLREALDPLPEIHTAIEAAIKPDPPTTLTDGGLIKSGYDDRLDALRETERNGKQWVDDLEAQERDRTGIDSLKVDYNDVHGYYIEVTNPNLDRVPEDYQRRQTLKNAERFVTPQLKEREGEILRAATEAAELEYELFRSLRETVAAETERLQALADALARLDVYVGLAEVAATNEYTRPELTTEQCLEIEGGRHPIVEHHQHSFVPNDTTLSATRRLAVITGPNMSGKSTYLRQVAVIVILAQAGSFVPATHARLQPLRRIFTRIGANDDIAGGRSTFLIEMLEVAELLRRADERSLVVLDEVGRGTSTADGLAIAQALVEYLHDESAAFTLFATHHHPVTETAAALPAATNLHFSAAHEDDEITFEHSIEPGPATASYGVEVASKAGVPEPVVDRARTLLDTQHTAGRPPALDRLAELDVSRLTPLEALNELAALKENLE